jgi:hypothetical protein
MCKKSRMKVTDFEQLTNLLKPQIELVLQLELGEFMSTSDCCCVGMI